MNTTDNPVISNVLEDEAGTLDKVQRVIHCGLLECLKKAVIIEKYSPNSMSVDFQMLLYCKDFFLVILNASLIQYIHVYVSPFKK